MRSIQFKLLCFLLIIGLPLVLLSACGGGGGSGDSGTSSSAEAVASTGSGSVSVSLTDNQALYNAVVLTIKEIGVVASNIETTYYNSADINELPVTVNVLDFPGEASLYLGDIEVPLPENGDEVCFSQIRLVLADEGNYVIENNDPEFQKHPLKTPSGQQSGVKVLAKEESFCLSEQDNAVNVAIEFDPETAIGFNEKRTNRYQLKPTSMRIIKGEFVTAPESFIDGLVALPTYNTATGCEQFSTDPFVTVTAYNSSTLESKTVALADGPFKENEACDRLCKDDATCLGDCILTEGDFCYYTGSFKLLLPEKEDYDLQATWDGLIVDNGHVGYIGEMSNIKYNSTVLLELEEQ
jgi:hypothetical protein